MQNLDREVKKCLMESFRRTDEQFLQKASEVSPSWKDGSTVAMVIVLDNTVYSANVGDSKAVLCRRSQETDGQLRCISLTKDHNPTSVGDHRSS